MGYALSRCSGLGRHALEGQVGYSAGGLIGVFDPRDPPFARFWGPEVPGLRGKSLHFQFSGEESGSFSEEKWVTF